jgi:hypothetical protein
MITCYKFEFLPHFSIDLPCKLKSSRAIKITLKKMTLIKRKIHVAIPRKQSKQKYSLYICFMQTKSYQQKKQNTSKWHTFLDLNFLQLMRYTSLSINK